jgi:hypothetical protein
LQPTPLRVDKIAAILRVRISYKVISIYQGGAAEWQAVVHLSGAIRAQWSEGWDTEDVI